MKSIILNCCPPVRAAACVYYFDPFQGDEDRDRRGVDVRGWYVVSGWLGKIPCYTRINHCFMCGEALPEGYENVGEVIR